MTSDTLPIWSDLDGEAFALAVKRGQGRAIMHLQHHDPTPYRDIVLDACLHNLAYDPQVEGSRIEYLSDLLRLSDNDAHFLPPIIERIGSAEDDHDIDQLYEVGGLLALRGHEDARAALYGRFRDGVPAQTPHPAEVLIELDGLSGFLFVAETLGKRIRADAESWEDRYLIRVAEDRIGKDVVEAALRDACERSLDVAAYLDSVRQTEARRKGGTRWNPAALSYDEVKHSILTGDRPLSRYQLSLWGKEADDASLMQAAVDLLNQDEPSRLIAYVSVFAKRPFPLEPSPLLSMARDSDEQLKHAALRALARIAHPAVRALALELLPDPEWGEHAVDLFAENLQAPDVTALQEAYDVPRDDFRLHSYGFDLIDLAKRHRAVLESDLVETTYNRTPCSNCRKHCFDLLASIQRLPTWMVEECQYDANPDLRDKARAAQAGGG